MKKLLFPFLILLFRTYFLCAQAPFIGNPPAWNWVQTIGGSGDDFGKCVSGDANGNFFVAGDFSGKTTFDNQQLISIGQENGFLVKTDPDGAVIWVNQFKSSTVDGRVRIKSMAADPNGNVLVLGEFSGGNLKIGGQVFPLLDETDYFLAKFAPDGTLFWNKPVDEQIFAIKVVADSDGSAVVLGASTLLKYDNNGNLQWSVWNPTGSETDIAISGNNLVLTGRYYEDVYIDSYWLHAPGAAIFFATMDKATGFFTGAKTLASHLDGFGLRFSSISMINETDYYIAGAFYNTINIGTITLDSPNEPQLFVAKFESDICSWAISSTGNGVPTFFSSEARVLATVTGDALLIGENVGAVTFDNTTLADATNSFLAKFNGANGALISLARQPDYIHNWTDGNNLIQTGNDHFAITLRKTNNAGLIVLDRTFDGDGGSGTVASIKKDGTGLYFLTNVSAHTSYQGQETYSASPSIVIRKTDFSGDAVQWQQTIAGATAVFTFGHSLWLDHDHAKLYLIGYYDRPFQFGAYAVDTTGGMGTFVAQMGTDGSFGWIKTFPASAFLNSVISDLNGNVLINGTFIDNLQIGNFSLHSAGFNDIFWAKLDINGQYLLAQRMGGEVDDLENYAGVDAQGNFYMSGLYYSNTIDINGAHQINAVEGDGQFYYIKFAPGGQVLWVKNFGDTDQPNLSNYCFASNVQVDASGNSFITGFHGRSSFFDSYHLTSPYNYNSMVARIDPDGNVVWAKSIVTKLGTFNFCEIGLDEAGDCYFGSQIRDSTYVEGTLLTRIGESSAVNGYWAKLNGADGALEWLKSISGSAEASVYPATISMAGIDNLFVGGRIKGQLNFEANTFNTQDGQHGFLALLGPDVMVSTEQPAPEVFFISVAPNPTANTVSISTPSQRQDPMLLEILNASGVTVAMKKTDGFTEKISLDLSGQAAGVYFLKASSKNGQQLVRIVKQ